MGMPVTPLRAPGWGVGASEEVLRPLLGMPLPGQCDRDWLRGTLPPVGEIGHGGTPLIANWSPMN